MGDTHRISLTARFGKIEEVTELPNIKRVEKQKKVEKKIEEKEWVEKEFDAIIKIEEGKKK